MPVPKLVSNTLPPPPETKRVNFLLSGKSYNDLQALSRAMSRSMTELIRLGIALLKVAAEADMKGHKLMVTTATGDPVKEVVLP